MLGTSFVKAGLVLRNGAADVVATRDLQRALRALGYLKSGIVVSFETASEMAVQSLQYDLLENDGSSHQGDGAAPVSVRGYNRTRVSNVTGEMDQDLAACIIDMLNDDEFPKLPRSDRPADTNARIAAQLVAITNSDVPMPFLISMLRQESGLRHFCEPHAPDEDSYIVVGLDRNVKGRPEIVTSRGYGVGQYTLFHHPPTPGEVVDIMDDVARNISRAARELRDKFDGFVNGPSSGTRADDRQYAGALRLCRFDPAIEPAKYMRACQVCAREASPRDIVPGQTPVYPGASGTYERTQYYTYQGSPYENAKLREVPLAQDFLCDWPFAARRYNGSGPNSYNYQAIVLRNLLRG